MSAIGVGLGRSPFAMRALQFTNPTLRTLACALALGTLLGCARGGEPTVVAASATPPSAQSNAHAVGNAVGEVHKAANEQSSTELRASLLERCRTAAAYSREHDGEVMLVLVHGRPVFEDAAAGFSARTPHVLASGSKSFVGVAAMCAVEDGFLSLDERVSATITEWQSDPRKSKVTIRQLLSLASGLEGLSAKIDSAASAREAGITDRAQASIDARMLAAPGERFIYGPSSFYVFGELLKRKLQAANAGDADILAYLDRRIFTPLEIQPQVQRDGVGNPNLAGGCRLAATDWARFGEFIRNGGVSKGVSLLSADLVAQLSQATGPNQRYGLTWWLLSDDSTDAEDDVAGTMAADRLENRDGPIARRLAARLREREEARAARSSPAPTDNAAKDSAPVGFMAAGKGKQRLYVLPEEGMTVVRFGALNGSRDFHDSEFLKRLLGQTE